MFQGILLDLFNFLTKPYLKTLDDSKLTTEFGLFKGEILLEDVQLNCEGLANLQLPVEFVDGHVASIHLTIPYGSISSESTSLEISGILLKARLNKNYQPPPNTVVEKKQDQPTTTSTESELPLQDGEMQRELRIYEKVAIQLAKNIVISFKNIHLEFEDAVSETDKPFALAFSLDSLILGNTDKNWFTMYARLMSVAIEKKLEMQRLKIEWSWKRQLAVLDQEESAWSSAKKDTVEHFHQTIIDHQEIAVDLKCIVMENGIIDCKVSGDVRSSPFHIGISRELVLSLIKTVSYCIGSETADKKADDSKPKIDKKKEPLFPLHIQCSIPDVQVLYYSEDNMIYSICLTKPFVSVEQESQDGMVSVKVAELQLAIHQGDKEHAINVFKGVTIDVITAPSLKVEAKITDWDLTLPSLRSNLYQYFPKVVAKVNASDEHIAFVQVWEDATKAGGSGATCVLLGLHNIIIMYHKAFSIILLEQLNQNYNLLLEIAKFIPKQNLELQCSEICIGLELSSDTPYIPIISLQQSHYIQTISDDKGKEPMYLSEKHSVKVELLDITRYEVKNNQVEFSVPCGPALSQLRSIDLLVNKFMREDYPDREMVEVEIKAEKFILKGGMQFGIDLKNFIIEIQEMIIKMFFPGLNAYPGSIIEAAPKPEISEEIGLLQKTKLSVVLNEMQMCVLHQEYPFNQPKILCDTSFLAITIMMNEFYSGDLKMDIASPTWTMWDGRLPDDAPFKQPVETHGMFSRPSVLVSYHRDQNSHESVLLDIALTRIYLWVDFLMDMVIFWLQVVPPQKDKNPEVALENLIGEQKNNPPKLEFVLNFQQDADIVVIESALMENPTCLVINFQGLTHFELDKYTWTQNMRVNVEKILVEYNHYQDITKQCWKLLDVTSFTMDAHGKPDIDPTDITFNLTRIFVSLTPTSTQMLFAMIPNMIPQQPDELRQISTIESANLWEPQPIDTSSWYLTGEDATSMAISLDTSVFSSSPVVNLPTMKVKIAAFELRLDNEINQKIYPAIALNATADAVITDWLADLSVSTELGLEASYYNDELAVWEPLLEPIESIESNYRPWVVKAQVVKNKPEFGELEIDQEKLESSFTRSSKALAKRVNVKMPQFTIDVTAEEPLQLTLTKRFLMLFIDVAIDFISPTAAKPSNQVDISALTAPFKVVNLLGPTFEIRVTPFRDSLTAKSGRYVSILHEQEMELYHKKSNDILPSSSLCGKVRDNLDHITINISRTCQLRGEDGSITFKPLREVPVTRTGKYYYKLEMANKEPSAKPADECSQIPDGIVLDISLVKDQRVVTVRSPVQFFNHTTMAVKLNTRTLVEHLSTRTREYNDVEFATMEHDKACAVPMNIAASKEFSIEPDLPEYSLSTHFLSRDNPEKGTQIDCESLLGSRNQNSLHIWSTIEEEQYVYDTDLSWDVPHHMFHLYPSAYFHNLLPFNIELVFENGRGMEERHDVKTGQHVALSCFSLKDYRASFIYKICEKGITTEQTMLIKKEKDFVYTYVHVKGQTDDHTMLHFDKKDTLEIYLYAPIWFVNKTGLPLFYRISHTKDVIEHSPGNKIQLFSFGSKTDGKKAIKLRVQDTMTEWSKSVSLDTAGYHGVVEIPGKMYTRKVGVKIRLTRCTLTKLVVVHPFYILVNNTENRIICHEVSKQWLDVAPGQTKAFWPHNLDHALMDINVDGHEYHSVPFNFNKADTLLLKLKGQLQAIKVNIHITSSTHVIIFDSYTQGDCPVKLVNNFNRVTIEYKQSTKSGKAPVHQLGPNETIMYSWDIPHEDHLLKCWVQGEKKELLMSLEDGQGRFEYRPKSPSPPRSPRHWASEKLLPRPSSSWLFVSHANTIDVPDAERSRRKDVDLDLFSTKEITIPIAPTSSTNEEESHHVRTNSFDLHDIKPSSSENKRTWRSVSAQPNFDDESDTTPLVDHPDAKFSSLRRKGVIKRPSSKCQKSAALSTSDGASEVSSFYKTPSKSTTDISKVGISKMDDPDHKPSRRFQIDPKKASSNKRTGHWVSLMDGYQRILLFTPHFHVVKNCDKASKFTFDVMQLNLTLSSINISLIDNNTNREILLLSVQPKASVWQIRQQQHQGWEDVSPQLNTGLEIARAQNVKQVDLDKLKIDLVNMKMSAPMVGDIRCFTHPCLEAQLKMGASSIFVQLKAFDIQLDNQLSSCVYPCPIYTEARHDSTESPEDPWFLDASVLLRKDKFGNVTRLDYLNAAIQTIHLRTDVGLVLALMDMFSGLQQEMTEEEKLLLDIKYASLSLSDKEVALASKKAELIFYDDFKIPELNTLITFTTKNLSKSKGDLSEESASLKFLKLFLTAMGTPFTEISEAEIKLNQFAVNRKNLTSKMLGDLISKHYRHEAMGQIFSVIFGMDLIKKPVTAVIGGTKKIFQGAYEGLALGVEQLRRRDTRRRGSVHIPIASDFGQASSVLDIIKSITDTDISFINRVRPTRVIKKDRIVRPYALHDAIGGTVIDILPSHGLTDVHYRYHHVLDDVPITLMVITNQSLYVATKSYKWREEYHTLLKNIDLFTVEGNALTLTVMEKKSPTSSFGSIVRKEITARDNRTAKEAIKLLKDNLIALGLYKP